MAIENDKHVYAIWGAPLGGKTTLAVNMATALADSGYMTCLVSATDHGELQSFFGVAIPAEKGLCAALTNGRHVREALTEARPNLCILELDTGGDAYELGSLAESQVTRMLADLKDHFAFVIIDCTNYKESAFTGIGLAFSDKVVVCIPHRASAATWHIANQQMLDAVANKSVYVDCNTRAGGCNIEQLLASIDLPECEIKFGCVDSAYLCENTSNPIVLQRGKQERRYRAEVLRLIKMLLRLEEPAAESKKAKRQKEKQKKVLGTPKERERDGLKEKKVSKRAQKKAEKEAMRRAKNGIPDEEWEES